MLIVFVFLFPAITFAQATVSCTDIGVNLYKGLETSSVLKLQNFLYAKGFLKAKPNGYYGSGTLASVKAYQKSVGITQTGSVAALTRARIKKDSCGTGATVPSATTNVVAKPVTSVAVPAIKPVVTEPAKVVPLTKNDQRRKDITIILQALAQRFRDTRVHSLVVSETPIELCVKPNLVATIASTTEGTRLVTPESPCKDYVDIAYLVPSYLSTIPRDPTLATTSVFTGYTITRSNSNDITIAAKNVDDKAVIKVTCNFNAGCPDVQQISTVIYPSPYIASIDRPIFLRNTTQTTGVTITGKGFTANNVVTLKSRSTAKEYILGTFSSTDGTTTQITPAALGQQFPCGSECVDGIPLGDYVVTVKNEGGISNLGYMTAKGYTTTSISSHGNSSVIPKSTNVKIGSITLSSDIPLTLTSLTLQATSTNKLLLPKILKLVLKDPATNSSVTASGLTFPLSNRALGINESKVFDIYADVDEVYVQEVGFIRYGGTVLAKDSLLGTELQFPIKEFAFTVSY